MKILPTATANEYDNDNGYLNSFLFWQLINIFHFGMAGQKPASIKKGDCVVSLRGGYRVNRKGKVVNEIRESGPKRNKYKFEVLWDDGHRTTEGRNTLAVIQIERSAINTDAANYEVSLFNVIHIMILPNCALMKKAINETMIFYTCGCCGCDEGLNKLVSIEDCADRLSASMLKAMWEAMIAPRNDDNASSYDRAYALAAYDEMSDGLLRMSKYICTSCVSELPKCGNRRKKTKMNVFSAESVEENNNENDDSCDHDDETILQGIEIEDAVINGTQKRKVRQIPKYALVNGYFRGKCPQVLKKLTLIEMNMVNLINVATRLCMLPQHSHYGSSGTVFSVINDINTVATLLPMNPREEDFALIRTEGESKTPKFLRYTPKHVVDALKWLAICNRNYDGVVRVPENDPLWSNGGLDEELDITPIISTNDDYEGTGEAFSTASETEGHAVNPGAPTNSEILLHSYAEDANMSSIELIQAIVSGSNGIGNRFNINRKQKGFITMDTTDYFVQKAFVSLYPYGRGGPQSREGLMTDSIDFNSEYIRYCLQLGDERSFQKCPTFLFFAYHWRMRQKSGIVSYLASSNDNSEVVDITATDAREFLSNATSMNAERILSKPKIRSMIGRMVPYAAAVPGTELFFRGEQKKLLSMVNSPVTNSKGQWRYFLTQAQSDLYMPELYDNAITSADMLAVDRFCHYGSSIEDRRILSSQLKKSERALILKDHPHLSARLFSLQQDAYWKYIIHGSAKPLGTVCDEWRRVEFQMKGTPHCHCLINVEKDLIHEGSVTSELESDRILVQNEVKRVSTAILVDRPTNDYSDISAEASVEEAQYICSMEKEYDFNIASRSHYFPVDENNPCRVRFSALKDYGRDIETGEFADPMVQLEYRRKQIFCQLHSCRESCFKYCKQNHPRICRYSFPRVPLPNNTNASVITKDKDRAHRVRISVHPPRNNANLNISCFDPLMFIAANGNQDIQFIQNLEGGVQYVCKYASKADTAESTALQNACCRKLSQRILREESNASGLSASSLHARYRSVCQALIEAQQIGSVQACYLLGGLKLVSSSRTVITVNALKRSEFILQPLITDAIVLGELEGTASAISTSSATQFGRRDAYFEIYKLQMEKYKSVTFNFFSFLSSFKLSQIKNGSKSDLKQGHEVPHLQVDVDGFISNAESFQIKSVKYTALKKLNVVRLSPYIPIKDDDERSAYSILLLYSDWTLDGECSLLGNYANAVDRLQEVRFSLPTYVTRSLNMTRRSEELLSKSGNPDVNVPHSENEDEDFEPDDADAFLRNDLIGFPGVSEAADVSSNSENATRVFSFTPVGEMAYLTNFIQRKKQQLRDQDSLVYSCNEEELERMRANPNLYIPINNLDLRKEELDNALERLNELQKRAYDIVVEHVSDPQSSQMILFLSGEGGTGKSTVIHAITNYVQILFGKTEGIHGAVLKTAPTGGAAYNIGGKTWHSALGKSMNGNSKVAKEISSSQGEKLKRELKGVKLFVLDEVSLLPLKDLHDISRRLCIATGNLNKPFGGIHTVLAGDFYQMKAIGGYSLVENLDNWSRRDLSLPRHTETMLGFQVYRQITHFVELLVNNRATQGPNGATSLLAQFCTTARKGNVTTSSLSIINQRVTNNIDSAMRDAHEQAIWICSSHDEIRTINAKFASNMQAKGIQSVTLVADHIPMNVGTPIPDTAKRNELYGVRGDPKGDKSQPALTHLRLFPGTRVRLTANLCVPMGLYNGAMGTVYGFKYKGRGPTTLSEMNPSPPFSTIPPEQRELPIVLVRMDGFDHPSDPSKSTFNYSCSSTVTRLVPIAATPGSPTICRHYKRVQYPLMVAHARTGHSMQGYTADHGVVIQPGSGSMFFAYDYVAISRAKEIGSILLLKGLTFKNFMGSFYEVVRMEYERLRNLHNNNDDSDSNNLT